MLDIKGSYSLYLDGIKIPLSSGSGFAATGNQNSIGATAGGVVAGTFNMANLTIWNGGTAMTEAQAQAFFYCNTMPSGPTLTRNYKHTDGSGRTLTAATGNQNGTIGAATWDTSVPTTSRAQATTRTQAA